jgi:hypothetical protein
MERQNHTEARQVLPDFNPLCFPPCACPRCRPGEDASGTANASGTESTSVAKGAAGDAGGDGDGGGDGNASRAAAADGVDAGADSPLLLRLRARVAEENGLRNALRRTAP